MNKIDKKIKRDNWPAIERALRHKLERFVMKETRSVTRRYYVDGIEPEYPENYDWGLDLTVRLLCEPDATLEQWAQWKTEAAWKPEAGQMQLSYLYILYDVQFSFGKNSLFGKRDAQIHDYFFRRDNITDTHGASDTEKQKAEREKNAYQNLVFWVQQCVVYIKRLKVNPYSQGYKGIESAIERVKHYSEKPYDLYQIIEPYGPTSYGLTSVVCPIELAYRHPEKFDPLIRPVVNLLHDFFVHPDTNSSLRDIYQQIVESQLDEYAEKTGAGGCLSVCIRYDTAEQLQAMLPMLYFDTRYPNKADDPEGAIRSLPPIGNRSFRASFNIVMKFWEAGFEPERHVVLDDTTLFLEYTVPLSFSDNINLLIALQFDATNLEEKLDARSDLPDDDIDGDYDKAALVYLLRPLQGVWRVGAFQQRDDNSLDYSDPANSPQKELLEGDSEEIDSIVNRDVATEIILESLISSGCQIILDNGHQMWGCDGWDF